MNIEHYTDREIVNAILGRDTFVTKEFLYGKCYPLFKAIHSKFYTDCETPLELINQIYVYILWPHPETHISKLEQFGFRCSLPMWIKVVVENYCQQVFKRRVQIIDGKNVGSDRKLQEEESITENIGVLDKDDLRTMLNSMPNERYRKLIELRYINGMSNEETATMLGLNMDNYYNCHKRAKEQYCAILRKEGLL